MPRSELRSTIVLFGEPACLVDGSVRRIGGPPRTLALLLFLVLHRELPMERRRLAFTLWPDTAEEEALANLRRHLHALTKALPALPDRGRWFEVSRLSVRWTAGAVFTDVTAFEEAVAAGDTEHAVSLYGGALCPAVDEEWADVARRRLAQIMLDALDRLVERDRERDTPRAIAWATRALGVDPWRESNVRTLVELHAAAGDSASARRVYHDFAQRLEREFCAAPAPETTAAYDRIAGIAPPRGEEQDIRARQLSAPAWPDNVHPLNAAVLPPDLPAWRPADATPHNLPVSSSSFVGRQREVNELRELVLAHRLVTLVGSGGIGKTRTSLQVAATLGHQWSQGIWLIELAPLERTEYLVPAIVQALNLIPATEGDPIANLVRALRAKCALLIFDNCEHLLEPAAMLINDILRHCPQINVLASSRQALAIDGEYAYRLPPLDLPLPNDTEPLTARIAQQSGAIELFVARARAAQQSFRLCDENAGAVAEICRRLDGIPLAIELAAVRMNILTPGQLSRRLDERFRVLTGGKRNALPRQQTLRALIDWSHDLLDDRERAVFRRLAIFTNGFTLEGADAVGSGDGIDECDVFVVLASLVEKSLILAEPAGDALRYRMLESTRAYAREKLDAAGEGDGSAARHLRWLRAYFSAAHERYVRTCQATELIAQFAAELDDVRAALAYAQLADVAAGARLLADIDYSWAMLGLDVEGLKHCSVFLDALPGEEHAVRARLCCVAAQIAGNNGRLSHAFAMAVDAVAHARAAGEPELLACALRRFVSTAAHRHQLADAEAAQAEAEALAPISRLQRLRLLESRAFLARHRGDVAAAADALGKVRAEWHATGQSHGEMIALIDLAEVEHSRGRTIEAIALTNEAIVRLRVGKNRLTLAQALCNGTAYALAVDDVPGSVLFAVEAIREAAAIDPESPLVAVAIEHLALARLLGGDAVLGATLAGYADARLADHRHERQFTERGTSDRLTHLLKERLPQDAGETLRAAGAAMPADAALASALPGELHADVFS